MADRTDCSLQSSSVHGISQARTLEWVAISSSRGLSWPKDQTYIFYISWVEGGLFTCLAIGKAPYIEIHGYWKEKRNHICRENLEWIWPCQVFEIGKNIQGLIDAKPRSMRIWYVCCSLCACEAYNAIRVKSHSCKLGRCLSTLRKDFKSLRNFKSRSTVSLHIGKLIEVGWNWKQKS